jgi:hypothetical protein
MFRRTLKDTFTSSSELKILLKTESEKKPNCRVQVLPVLWRQEIQFGISKELDSDNVDNVAECDIGDVSEDEDLAEDSGNPTLKDITVESIAPIRTLISDGISPSSIL